MQTEGSLLALADASLQSLPSYIPGDPAPGSSRPTQPRQPVKRGGLACKRCRRYRTKCLRASVDQVCAACMRAGVAQECHNPHRGEHNVERSFRRRQLKDDAADPTPAEVAAARGVLMRHAAATGHLEPEVLPWSRGGSATPSLPPSRPFGCLPSRDVLPPPHELEEALQAFRSSYFQLGFLPLSLFVQRLELSPDSISLFLLLAILTISARYTPSLVERFGNELAATEFYAQHAYTLIGNEMLRPSLQNCQAFFILAAYEWGSTMGDDASAMLMGIAARIAGLLCLHKEATYVLPEDAPPEHVIQAEVARRTFWLIASQEDLTSGRSRQAPFAISDIDVLLPCSEDDFAFGIVPAERASLHGTRPALIDPDSVHLASRSLFATMLQAHAVWGRVARLVCTNERGNALPPWLPDSDFATANREIAEWHSRLPAKHRWSPNNLRGMRTHGVDLAFLEIHVMHHLSCIVLRRSLLKHVADAAESSSTTDTTSAPADFCTRVAEEMVQNSRDLIAAFDEFCVLRPPRLGVPPILVFAIYVCGTVFSFLERWPKMCPEHAHDAPGRLQRCLDLLSELNGVWPLADWWRDALNKSRTTSVDAADFRVAAQLESARDEIDGIYRHAPLDFAQARGSQLSGSNIASPPNISPASMSGPATSPLTARINTPNDPALAQGIETAVPLTVDALLQGRFLPTATNNGGRGGALAAPPGPADLSATSTSLNAAFSLNFEDDLLAFFRGGLPSANYAGVDFAVDFDSAPWNGDFGPVQ